MAERLHKYLARAGVASRRRAEELIQEGRISVNNEVVRELGTKVEAGKDLVTVDGKLVSPPDTHGYYMLYKPVGVVTTMDDPQGRPTVARYVEELGRRVFPVGRLDFDAEGALIFTDDGELANQLTHPRYGVRRTYLAKVKGTPSAEALEKLLTGVRLEDGEAKANEASIFEEAERNTWVKLTVSEGRPHLVKRMFAAIGHPVVRLYRPMQGGISVRGLRPGEVRELKESEVERLRAIAGGAKPSEEELTLPPRRHGHGAPGSDDDDVPVTVVERGPARTVRQPKPGRAFGEKGEEPRRRGAFGDRSFGGTEGGGYRKREHPGGHRAERGEGEGASRGGGERRAFGGGRRVDRETSRGEERGERTGGGRSFGGERGGAGRGERTGGGRSFGGERAGGRSFGGERGAPRGERSERGGFERGEGAGGGRKFGAGPRGAGAGRSFGERGERTGGGRSFGGERGAPRGERSERGGFDRGEGGGRRFGGERSEGGGRRFGGERSEGGGRKFGAGPRGAGGGRSFGERGERSGGGRSFGGERGGARGERGGFERGGEGGGRRTGGGRDFGAAAGGRPGGGRGKFGTTPGGGRRGPGGAGRSGPGGPRTGAPRGGPRSGPGGGRGGPAGGRGGPGRSGGGRNGGRGGGRR